MLNRSASLAMSTSVLKALPGKLDIKRHSPSILYISASLAMSTSVLKALPGKLDIKRHSPSILYIMALCLAFDTGNGVEGREYRCSAHVSKLNRWYLCKGGAS